MSYQNYSNLKGTHATFSPSNPAFLRYDINRVREILIALEAKKRGTRLHGLAEQLINEGILQRKTKDTFNSYVNDGIGFRMQTEQVLYYDKFCYGTADSICFDRGLLRIHDLKTGRIPAHIEQLEIYAALYCLEHDIRPSDIDMELRIYQNNEIFKDHPDSSIIASHIDQIKMVCDVAHELEG